MTVSDEVNVQRLRRVAAGDAQAFQDLYNDTAGRLLGTCYRVLGDRPEAEEAMQEAYLAVWRRAAQFDPGRGSAKAWLATLARNCAVDRLRTRTKLHVVPLELGAEVPDQSPPASDMMVRREENVRMTACLELLDGDDHLLIRTAFFQGSTYTELASRTNRPLGTIKSRIRRALIKLAECLR